MNPFCVLPDAFYPTRNPNASQWNIGCVGSLALALCVGHVHFIFFVLISFALGSRRKRSFQWNMGFGSSRLGSQLHREFYGKQGKWPQKIPVRETTGNLEILSKHNGFFICSKSFP